MDRVAGVTSTGSKRPAALFGDAPDAPLLRMVSSRGCRFTGDDGREYLDLVMALGAVALGYGHPAVNDAVIAAVHRGGIGPVPPIDEDALAADLQRLLPHLEQVRFFKTGAEAVAAAVRLSRAYTGRDRVLGAGYFGWLDWSSREAGVPDAVRALYMTLPFNEPEACREAIRAAGDSLACVVVEPVIEAEPDPAWLEVLREETRRVGALLVFDEIKTALRVAPGGAVERWGGGPDLVVLGKAIANGFPLAAAGGRAEVMRFVDRTWISSTMATEFISLAAARATLATAVGTSLHSHLRSVGTRLHTGFVRLARRHPRLIRAVRGIPEMCHLDFVSQDISSRVAVACARRGLLFKRTAYNFVSLAHQPGDIDAALETIGAALEEVSEHAAG